MLTPVMISLPLSSDNPYLILSGSYLISQIISDPPDLPFILSDLMCYMHLPHLLLIAFICPTCALHMFLHALPIHPPCFIHAYFIAAHTVHLMLSSCLTCIYLMSYTCSTHVYLMDFPI